MASNDPQVVASAVNLATTCSLIRSAWEATLSPSPTSAPKAYRGRSQRRPGWLSAHEANVGRRRTGSTGFAAGRRAHGEDSRGWRPQSSSAVLHEVGGWRSACWRKAWRRFQSRTRRTFASGWTPPRRHRPRGRLASRHPTTRGDGRSRCPGGKRHDPAPRGAGLARPRLGVRGHFCFALTICAIPVAPLSQGLYRVNMPRARHPRKDVETALAWAEAAGWRVTPTSSGHRWGVMRCGSPEGQAGCQASIWSTPRNPSDHGRQIMRRVQKCPHRSESARTRR